MGAARPGCAEVTKWVELLPLTAMGVRTLARQALHWEAPDALVAWLHRISGGYPEPVFDLLLRLAHARLIVREGQSWHLNPDVLGMDGTACRSRRRSGPPRTWIQPAASSEGSIRLALPTTLRSID